MPPPPENELPGESPTPSNGTPGWSIFVRILSGAVGLGMLVIFILHVFGSDRSWEDLANVAAGIFLAGPFLLYAFKGERGFR